MKKIGSTDDLDGAFHSCENLRSVVFEQGSELAEIGDNAFYGCKNLQNICLPDKLKKIGWSALNQSGLTEVQIPASVQTVRPSAFPEQAVVLRPADY